MVMVLVIVLLLYVIMLEVNKMEDRSINVYWSGMNLTMKSLGCMMVVWVRSEMNMNEGGSVNVDLSGMKSLGGR